MIADEPGEVFRDESNNSPTPTHDDTGSQQNSPAVINRIASMAEKFKNSKISSKSKNVEQEGLCLTSSMECQSGLDNKPEGGAHNIMDEQTVAKTRLPSSLAISKSGLKSRFSQKSFSSCDMGTTSGSHSGDDWLHTSQTFDDNKMTSGSFHKKTASTMDSEHGSINQSAFDNLSDIEADMFDLPMEGEEEGPCSSAETSQTVTIQNTVRGRGRGHGRRQPASLRTHPSEKRTTKRNRYSTQSSDDEDCAPRGEFCKDDRC